MHSASNLPAAEQKGHTLILVLLLIAVAAGLLVMGQKNKHPSVSLPNPGQQNLQKLSYQDPDLKFEFKYPANLDVVTETEEQYSKRTETEYRKNFAGYVGYQPPKQIKSLVVKPKGLKLGSSQFDVIPLAVWVFENPQKLDQTNWYKSYWYYPFVWGIFVTSQKNQIAPQTDATVSGIPTKSAVIGYSPGKPEFILLPKGDKMFLFKVMEGGNKILNSFKFN